MGVTEDNIHGLSQVEFIRGQNRDLAAYSYVTQSDRDHIASLDGLALLLVFAAKGAVAAVTYWRSRDEFKLLWAKNQPVNDQNQLCYIKTLLENAKNGIKTDGLLHIVIAMCKEKILYRIKKLAKAFGSIDQQEESNLWQFDPTKESHQNVEAALKKAGWLRTKSAIHILDDFTRSVGKVTKASEIKSFLAILRFSRTVTSVADLAKILKGDQIRYLNKLSDYVHILDHIPSLLKKIGNAKIVVEQVRTYLSFLFFIANY
jgi:hypothetical protein